MGTPTGFKGFLGGQFEGRCIYFFKDVTETKWDFAAVGCTRSGTLRRWPLGDFAPPPKRHCWTPTQLPPSASPRPKGAHHLTQPIPRHFRLRHRPQHRPGHGRLGQLNRRSSAAATAGTHFAASVAADILAVLDFASRLVDFFLRADLAPLWQVDLDHRSHAHGTRDQVCNSWVRLGFEPRACCSPAGAPTAS